MENYIRYDFVNILCSQTVLWSLKEKLRNNFNYWLEQTVNWVELVNTHDGWPSDNQGVEGVHQQEPEWAGGSSHHSWGQQASSWLHSSPDISLPEEQSQVRQVPADF